MVRRVLVGLLVVGTLAGCGSKADVASKNLSKAAENFEVQRRIVGINDRSGEYVFDVEGRCSLETANSKLAGYLEVTCKHGKDDFRKHYVGTSRNTIVIQTQLEGIDVSEYRTRIIIKPENLVPNLDLVTGEAE